MEKINLSLKSIYRLLMTNDFPIYSESVIDEKNRKGQTLLKFWQSLVIEEFRSMPCGQIIWRNDGRRNRYISNLCNRNPEMRLYTDYAKELSSQINRETLMDQIGKFSVFLSTRNYKHDILLRRVRELIRLTESDDPHMTALISSQITDAICWAGADSREDLFHASYLLTILMLYAAAGEAMDHPSMGVLRADALGIQGLWDHMSNPPKPEGDRIACLTCHVGMLQDNPLPHQRFFGREEELFNLKEMASQSRKCLISGVGGIGKTELLRQLIRSCQEEQTVDLMAVIPYSGSLVDSFSRVFPGFRPEEAQEHFHHTLFQLEQHAQEGRRVLVLIDNMNRTMQEDPDLQRLCELPCGVLITSRRPDLEGFEVLRIGDPSVSTCGLIFRDNYEKPLSSSDREELTEMLQNEALCHPLTLRLMARAAHCNGWTLGQLKDHLRQNRIPLTWVDEDRILRLDQIYRQLYSYALIPEACRQVAELFPLLPRDSYSGEFLADLFPILNTDGNLDQHLQLLADGGWLDRAEDGYSMHPLICHCLRRKILPEKKLEPILECLSRKIPQDAFRNTGLYHDPRLQRLCHIHLSVARHLTGSISRNRLLPILNAMDLLIPDRAAVARYEVFLNQLYRRCTDRDDLLEIRCYTTLAHWNTGDPELVAKVYHRQKAHLNVPRMRYLDFCLYAGSVLMLHGQFPLAEEMLLEVLSPDADAIHNATAYYHLALHGQMTGNAEAALARAQQGVEYVTAHPECGQDLVFVNLSVLCSFWLRFGQKAQALALLNRIETMLRDNPLPMQMFQYEDLAGAYELNYGNLDQALVHYQKAAELRLQYYGKDPYYYNLMGQTAQVYQRLKRFDDALEQYRTVIAYASQSGDPALLHMYSNNLAVLYLDLERPDEAISHLNTALSFARNVGGIALGECLKNMARAHSQLAQQDSERVCLEEAVPLLEAAYGAEHPRASAARKRLEELRRS